MSSEPPTDKPPTDAERRLEELLGLLREHPPASPPQITDRVVRTARFERGIRSTTRTAASFGNALLESLAVLLGLRRSR
jgi:hypothetical protein